jgi:signal transduction histidine kinase
MPVETNVADTFEHRNTEGEIYASQVRAVYQHMPMILAVNVVNSALVALVLASYMGQTWWWMFFAAVVACNAVRALAWSWYRLLRKPATTRWGMFAAIGSGLSGLLWGAASTLFLSENIVERTFMAFVVGGMCVCALVALSTYLPALIGFVFLAALPLAASFLLAGETVYVAMGCMAILFVAAVTFAAHHFNRAFVSGVRTNLSLDERTKELTKRTEELTAANSRLESEIAQRKAAEDQLHQARKMEALGQLTGGIAHDFNNLLTVAYGSLELLEHRISDERGLHLLQNAQGAMSRGAKLTGSLLAYARKQHLEPVLADINSIVVDVTDLLRRTIGDTIEIRYTLANALWPTVIDTNQIETALLNVATNARDAMPSGGVLLVETANIPTGSDGFPEDAAGQDSVLVSMTDTGTGMSPEVIERAFDPFFTTKEVGKGTGLGLSTVFGVVRQSGGTVRIHSRVGEGTTVQIYLPRASGRSIARREDESSVIAQPGADAHIHVVDDDPAVRWVTVECLREMGHLVAEADSGQSALTILERGDPFDLLVMDVVMPGLSGPDTVRLARRIRSDLKVLFVTGYDDSSATAGKDSTDPLIMKPFKPTILAEAVRNALGPAPPAGR